MNLVETLDLMKGKDLVILFNEVCDEGQEVKKFRDKQAGIDKLIADFDEESLLAHLNSQGVESPENDEVTAEEEGDTPDAKPRRKRSGLSDDSVLRLLRTDTKSRCALDIIAAIEGYGGKATVAEVLAEVCHTHNAPRSLVARQAPLKPGFVRGYVTDMIRKDFIEVG